MTSMRDVVVAAVGARTPVDGRERHAIEVFLAALDRLGDDPFDETANPVHVTASALIVGGRGVVLHRHKVLGTWVPPGGHIDRGETPWEAAVREAHEETGLRVRLVDETPDLVHVDVHPGPHGHTHLDLRYLLHGSDADPAPPPNESQDVIWCSWAEAMRRAEPSATGIISLLSTVQEGFPGGGRAAIDRSDVGQRRDPFPVRTNRVAGR